MMNYRSSRGLAKITKGIRKIDETSGIKGPLPIQLGYLENLQELYARRVGIYGPIPKVFQFPNSYLTFISGLRLLEKSSCSIHGKQSNNWNTTRKSRNFDQSSKNSAASKQIVWYVDRIFSLIFE